MLLTEQQCIQTARLQTARLSALTHFSMFSQLTEAQSFGVVGEFKEEIRMETRKK